LDDKSELFEALQFVLDPIKKQFQEQPEEEQSAKERHQRISAVGQKLSILDTRFRSKVSSNPDPKWPTPFSVEFSLWESIHRDAPDTLAKSITQSTRSSFAAISIEDALPEGRYGMDIGRVWSEFIDELLACLIADMGLTKYYLELATVCQNPVTK
jgi:hypothetical protein